MTAEIQRVRVLPAGSQRGPLLAVAPRMRASPCLPPPLQNQLPIPEQPLADLLHVGVGPQRVQMMRIISHARQILEHLVVPLRAGEGRETLATLLPPLASLSQCNKLLNPVTRKKQAAFSVKTLPLVTTPEKRETTIGT